MKTILLFFVSLIFTRTSLSAQAMPIDTTAIASWPHISNVSISSDGKFVLYNIVTGALNHDKNPLWVIRSVKNDWKKEISDAMDLRITEDSRRLIYRISPNILNIQLLGGSSQRQIAGVSSYKVPDHGAGRWIAYQQKEDKRVVLLDMFAAQTFSYQAVDDFVFSPNGKVLIIAGKMEGVKSSSYTYLLWVDLVDQKIDTIFNGDGFCDHFCFDDGGEQLAFIQRSIDGKEYDQIFYYRVGMNKAIPWGSILFDPKQTNKLTDLKDYIITGSIKFSSNGNKLFCRMKAQEHHAPLPAENALGVDVTIWSFADSYLPIDVGLQERTRKAQEFWAAFHPSNDTVIRLTFPKDDLTYFKMMGEGNAESVMILSPFTDVEMNPNLIHLADLIMISTKDGSRTVVKKGMSNPFSVVASPTGKYIVWFDSRLYQYFAYNVISCRLVDFTKKISSPLYDNEDDHPGSHPLLPTTWTWLHGDSCILINDKYDVWSVDPEGIQAPVNVTNGYGARHKIVFRQLNLDGDFYHEAKVGSDQKLYLIAFNQVNKENGFFSKQLGRQGDPAPLIMGPFIFYLPFLGVANRPQMDINFMPLKARDTAIWVVTRMSCSEYPNLQITGDFKTFQPLTDLSPQNGYNWYRSELLHWTLPDGHLAEGILYKPSNFNPRRKYPVLFHYYEKLADGVNEYLFPSLSEGRINIPWFVSHDYLVFEPDIIYRKEAAAESALMTVESAARYLVRLPYIDSAHMGLQGHSFGGYETNYIVTRTNRFAAAAPAAGFSDLVSGYGSLVGGSTSRQFSYERGLHRIGATLWEKPNLYITGSPVLQADRVHTPLLIMHNTDDANVPWVQSVEWFMALRRLSKPAWLLQYEGEKHTLHKYENKLDYTVRLQQFYDHYLKGIPAPQWMTGAEIEKLAK